MTEAEMIEAMARRIVYQRHLDCGWGDEDVCEIADECWQSCQDDCRAALDAIREHVAAERDAAFRAGAEAMRAACAGAVRGKNAAEFYRQLSGLLRAEELIRALPLPAHLKAREAQAFKLGRDSAGRA